MNYTDISYNMERQPQLKGMSQDEMFRLLKDAVISIRKELFPGRKVSTYLSEQISLLDGFVLLLALNDEISEVKSGRAIDKLKRSAPWYFFGTTVSLPTDLALSPKMTL